MNKTQEALRLALEALERLKLAFFKNAPDGIEQWESDWVVPSMNAIAAIREALAESSEALAEKPAQQQEPSAWKHPITDDVFSTYGMAKKSCGVEQEPVALYESFLGGTQRKPTAWWIPTIAHPDMVSLVRWSDMCEPLYTSPPASKPLTDEQIMEMYNEPRSDAEMIEFARAIEAAHGIKGGA